MRRAAAPTAAFLLGCQRSGTTAFATHLQRHPELALTVNGKVLYLMIVWLLKQPQHIECLHARLDEIAFAFARKSPYNVDARAMAAIQDYLATGARQALERHADTAAAIREIFFGVARILNPDMLCAADKYNEYLLQLDDIDAVFPDARFVFIYRDPFDVAESMVRHFRGRPWAPATYLQGLQKWVAWNEKWLRLRARIGTDRYYQVSYERLVANPGVCYAEVIEFLGLAPSAEIVAAASSVLVGSHVGKGRHVRASLTDDERACLRGAGISLEAMWDRLGGESRSTQSVKALDHAMHDGVDR